MNLVVDCTSEFFKHIKEISSVMDSYDILVITLSVVLSISLIVWLSVGILFVQVLKRLKSASDTAKAAAENVEDFTSQLKNVGKLSAVGTIIGQITKAFKGRNSK